MEFILSFLLVVFLVGWLLKKLLPPLLVWYITRKAEKNGGSFGNFGAFTGNPFGQNPYAAKEKAEEEVRRSKEQEGKVTVANVEQKEKVIEKGMGEYIDFEEEK